jgi:hypothetical protein
MMPVATLQDSFVRYLPWMRKTARLAFQNLDSEKREENIAATIALAWKHWHRLGERGRAGEPGILKSVLFYSIKQTKAGRRIDTAAKPRCPMTLRAWGKVNFEPGNLEDFVGWTTPVLDAVSFRIDIPRFLDSFLTERQRNLALDLAQGMTTSEAAQKYNRTPGAISQFRTRFKVLFDRFFAE